MTIVRDVMSTDVVRISPELSLRQLAELIASKHLCCVAVTDGWTLTGVATAMDVLDAVTNTPAEYAELPVDADAEDEGEDRATASFYSELYKDAGAEVATRFDVTHSAEWDSLDDVTVGEAMSHQLYTIDPAASVEAAARKMDRLGIQRLLVVEDGNLLGLVSTADISRAVGRGIIAAGPLVQEAV